jgi:arsenite-transporting ATPase
MTLDSHTSEEREPRLILYVGKGGVGKTTIAAATAVRAAELGHRTLVVSTDIAHSLGDVLGAELDSKPRQICDSLFAEEINVLDEVRQTWGKVQSDVADFLRREGASEIQADELAIMPGMEELAALVQIRRRISSGQFDCIVVDAAPTGETIRLLSLPESYQWYSDRVMAWSRRLTRFAGPLLRSAIPDLGFLDVVGRVADRVKDLRTVLTDPRRSSHRIVVTPDRVVLKEALRAETYLNVFEYPIDAVVVNRLLSFTKSGDEFVGALATRQEEVVGEIQRTFASLPLLQAPWSPAEPVGTTALSELARQLFVDRDPTEVMHVGPTQQIDRVDDGYLLRIPMPHVEIGKLSLRKRGDALYVDVANCRREISLPRSLVPLEPTTARMRDGMLEIRFVRTGQGETAKSVSTPTSET